MRTALHEQLQAALGHTYTLERELGGGGMSRVFLAEEARLGRRVVVKVLASELTEGMSAERFEREVRLAARLQHPNIVPLLAAGDREGLAYYTMPYVEGESLRARLVREGRLPLDAAVSVLRDMARALEYAHSHHVVHRDIKPDNVLLAGSAAAVADFGIAKALHVARTAGTTEARDDGNPTGTPVETLTRSGTSLGTPAYMAPEQAAGDPDVDARADVYSWGVVAYELLTGSPPFAGRSSHQLVVAHIGERPSPVTERAPGVPPALGALVMQCLEKDPGKRPQSAGELLAALEVARTPVHGMDVESTPARGRASSRRGVGVLAAALLGVMLATLGGVVAYRARHPATATAPVLAVLPFENLGAPSDAYFAQGLTDEVRSRLARVSGLQVIGGTSARQYAGTTKPAREIGRELGATHLLTASVRWEREADGGGRVRVSPELVRTSDQASLWAEPVEGPLTDVFQLQASVAERVAAALDVALGDRERRVVVSAAAPTANLAAYDAYLRGLAYATPPNQETRAGRRSAAEAFERAIALDPSFAAAHARLALVYVSEYNFSGTPGMMERARASVGRALALDSSLVESRLAQAQVLSWSGDGEGAYRALQVAERSAPSDAEVALDLGGVVWQLGRDGEAIAAYERAERLEPRMSLAPGMLAGAYEAVSRYEDAMRARERELALAPQGTAPYVWQAGLYLLWRADTAAARRTLARAEPGPLIAYLARFPSPYRGGRTLWIGLEPPAVLVAQDTMTLAGFLREGDTPDLYHLMKARHFWMTGRPARARVHADSIIALLASALRRGPDSASSFGAFTKRTTLAEAYAYAGRPADAAPLLDSYVDSVRAGWGRTFVLRPPYALVTAAHVDVLIGRRDLAVARLEEAICTPPGGRWISRALLRADPWWAPLRGHAGFERLVAEHDCRRSAAGGG